jgi:signal peptide peptidase SppA
MKALLESQDLLLIDPRRWSARIATLAEISPGAPGAMGFEDDDGNECDCYGDPIPQMAVDADGIATVPVRGTIQTGLPSIASAFGFVDTAKIRRDMETALADSNVRAILLDFDSPGGFVSGTPELGAFIAEAAKRKPVYSFTSGMCCSAAYWLAAPSRAIFATTSAEVGSIGVYVAHEDMSALAAAMGIVVKVFRSGKFKGAGVPGTSLSEEQSASIQQRISSLAAVFKGFVLEHRPGIAEAAMEGQTFMGYEAGRESLTDALVSDIGEAKKTLLADLT